MKSSAEEGRSKAEWTVRNLWQFGNELTPGTAVNPHLRHGYNIAVVYNDECGCKHFHYLSERISVKFAQNTRLIRGEIFSGGS